MSRIAVIAVLLSVPVAVFSVSVETRLAGQRRPVVTCEG
jgi:hypothetical protein